MEKAIIALLALGGIAMGATLGEIDTTDEKLKAYWNFDTSNEANKGDGWSELPTWNSAGYGECTTRTAHPYTSLAGLKAADGFTVSFDINNAGAGTLLSLSSGTMNQTWRSISVLSSQETSGDWTLKAQFHGATTTAVTKTLTLAATDWTTLTLVGSASGSTLNLDFYVNGEHAGTSSTNNATNITGGNVINNVQFGYLGNASNSASTNIDNILVYQRALTADQVKALTTVPEPTTATLSLLALAGLAARRRRK